MVYNGSNPIEMDDLGGPPTPIFVCFSPISGGCPLPSESFPLQWRHLRPWGACHRDLGLVVGNTAPETTGGWRKNWFCYEKRWLEVGSLRFMVDIFLVCRKFVSGDIFFGVCN